jgi:hypothetical protein
VLYKVKRKPEQNPKMVVTVANQPTNQPTNLTPCSSVLREKLTVTQLAKRFPPFVIPESSLPCSQELTTGPYPAPSTLRSRNRNSSVVQRWAKGWMIGIEFRQVLGIFLFTTVSTPALGSTQPPIQWAPGGLSLVVKRPWREAERLHLLPTSRITPLPQYAFMTW